MSLIERKDIGSRYIHTSWAVTDELEKILTKGTKSKDFPIWSFEQARNIFRLAAEAFDYPQNPPEALAHLHLVSDVLKKIREKNYDTREERIKDLELCANILEKLPELNEENAHHYNTLLNFFEHLRFTQESCRYDTAMSGRQSRYAFA